VRQGEIGWAQLPAPLNLRPVLLLSRDEAYRVRTQATVAYLTTRIRDIAAEVRLGQEDGLPQPCVVNLDNINTIRLARLRERITALPPSKMRAVDLTVRVVTEGYHDRRLRPCEWCRVRVVRW